MTKRDKTSQKVLSFGLTVCHLHLKHIMCIFEDMGHDQLQAKCFQWFWNYYPSLRQLMWHTPNEVPQDDYLIKEVAKQDKSLASKLALAAKKRLGMFLSRRKAIGVVKGVLDLTLYYNGKLHTFDVKLGKDVLSKEQISFIEQVKKQGGTFDVITTFEGFQQSIFSYIGKPEK